MATLIDSQTAVVFDLDDTLYNEVSFLQSAYADIAHQLEPQGTDFLYSRMFSMYRNSIDVFAIIAAEYGVSKEFLLDQYRQHVPNISLFDGVLNFMDATNRVGAASALLTDGRGVTQRNKISALGLANQFTTIVISEEFGSEKPSLENFRAIEKAIPKKRYLYIADNLRKDFLGPNKLGWASFCLIDNGLNIHSNAYKYIAPEFQPQAYFRTYPELISKLFPGNV